MDEKRNQIDPGVENNSEVTAAYEPISLNGEVPTPEDVNVQDSYVEPDGEVIVTANASHSVPDADDAQKPKRAPAHAAHAKPIKGKAGKRALIIIGIIVAIIVAAAIAVFAYFNSVAKEGKDLFDQTVWPEDIKTVVYDGQTYEYNPNIIPICVIGNDKTRHDPGMYFNGQADAVDVIAIDTQTGETTCITIPRDTMVEHWVTNYGTETIVSTTVEQLCLAYAEGKSDEFSSRNVCNSVSTILDDVPIEYYFTIQETAIGKIVDAVGGVTLVPMDTIPYNYILSDEGDEANIYEGEEITLTGDQSMQYLLWRDTNVAESADRRHERQEQFIKEFASQVIQKIKANPALIKDLYEVAAQNATTNLTESQFVYLASIVLDHGITSFDTVALEGTITRNDETGWEELTLDEDSTMRTVLDVFYNPASS